MKETQVHLSLSEQRGAELGAALAEASSGTASWTPLDGVARPGRLAFRTDFLDADRLAPILLRLSERFGVPVFGVSVWDSDDLWLQLAVPGAPIARLEWPARRTRGVEAEPFRARVRPEVTETECEAVLHPRYRELEDAESKLAELTWLFGWTGMIGSRPELPLAKSAVAAPPDVEPVGLKVSVKPVQVCAPGEILQLHLNARNRGGPGRGLFVAIRSEALSAGAFELTGLKSAALKLVREDDQVGRIFRLPKLALPGASQNASTGALLPADLRIPTLEVHAKGPGRVEGEVRISTEMPEPKVRAQRLTFEIVDRGEPKHPPGAGRQG